MVINKTTFTQNTAADGGALSISSKLVSKKASVKISNCILRDNVALDHRAQSGTLFFGGALSLADAKSVDLLTTNFTNNSATGAGAVNIIKSSTPLFEGCLFDANLASGISSGGGAMAVSSGALPVLQYSVFINNQGTFGGAISIDTDGGLQAKNVACNSNRAFRAGGCISLAKTAAVNFFGSQFSSNVADSMVGGGVLYSQHVTSPTFTSCKFKLNTVSEGDGGVFKIYFPATAYFLDCYFDRNSASVSGGVGMLEGTNATFTNSTFVANSVDQMRFGGGALALFKSAHLAVTECSFSEHYSFQGAVIYTSTSGFVINLSTFRNNTATKGAAIQVKGSTIAKLTNSWFFHNIASGKSISHGVSGSAIHITSGSVRVSGCHFEGNVADLRMQGQGGAIWVGAFGSIEIDHSKFLRNEAVEGAAAFISTAQPDLSAISESRFEENTALVAGGGLVVSVGAYCKITNSHFEQCSSNSGGGIYTAGNGLAISSTTFTSCRAREFGGAINVRTSGTDGLQVSSGSMIANQAAAGGGVYFENGKLASIVLASKLTSVTFSNNRVSFYGPDMASEISHLSTGDGGSVGLESVAIQFRGAVAIEPSVSVNLHDAFDSVVNDHVNGDGVECTIDFPPELLFDSGEMLSFTNQGQSHFRSTAVAGFIGQSYNVAIGCRWNRCLGIVNVSYESRIHTTWNASQCLSGEETLVESVPSGREVHKCRLCQATTFSIGRDSFACSECPEGAECPGGDSIIAEEGYWNGGVSRADVYECPAGEISCPGGVNNTCGHGFDQMFHVCGKCSEGYTYMGGKCLACTTDGLIALLPMFGILFGVISIIAMIAYCIKRYFDSVNSETATEEDSKAPSNLSIAKPTSTLGIGIELDSFSKSNSSNGTGSGSGQQPQDEAAIIGQDLGGAEGEPSVQNEGVAEGMEVFGEDGAEFEDPDTEGMMDSFEHLNVILKIVLGYLQVSLPLQACIHELALPDCVDQVLTAVTFTMPSVPWPQGFIDSISQPFSFLNFDFSQMFPIGCLVHWDFYLDMEFSFTLPILACSAAVLNELWRGMRVSQLDNCQDGCCEDHEHVHDGNHDATIAQMHTEIRNSTWKMVLLSLFVMYPMLVTKMLGVFLCRPIEGDWWLEADVSLQCYTDQWTLHAGIGMVGICAYCIGIPALFFWVMYVHKDQMEDADVIAKIGFLFTGYAAHFWLGELVEMTRKMFMSGIVMFVAPGSVMQVIVATAFCAIFLMVQVTCNPFEEPTENKVCQWTMLGTALTVMFGLLIMTSKGSCNSAQVGSEIQTIASAILVVNMFVFLMIIFWTAKFLKTEIEAKAELVLAVLGKVKATAKPVGPCFDKAAQLNLATPGHDFPCPTCQSPIGDLRRAYAEATCCVCLEATEHILVSECGHLMCKECAAALPHGSDASFQKQSRLDVGIVSEPDSIPVDAVVASSQKVELSKNLKKVFGRYTKYRGADDNSKTLELSELSGACLQVLCTSEISVTLDKLEQHIEDFVSQTPHHSLTCEQFEAWFMSKFAQSCDTTQHKEQQKPITVPPLDLHKTKNTIATSDESFECEFCGTFTGSFKVVEVHEFNCIHNPTNELRKLDEIVSKLFSQTGSLDSWEDVVGITLRVVVKAKLIVSVSMIEQKAHEIACEDFPIVDGQAFSSWFKNQVAPHVVKMQEQTPREIWL